MRIESSESAGMMFAPLASVLLLGLAARAQHPACRLRLRSPRFDQVFSFEDEIELGTKLHLADASVARRVRHQPQGLLDHGEEPVGVAADEVV